MRSHSSRICSVFLKITYICSMHKGNFKFEDRPWKHIQHFSPLSLPKINNIIKRVCVCVCTRVRAQLCLILCDPQDCSLSGSYVHGLFQTRILERVAIFFSHKIYKMYYYSLRCSLWELIMRSTLTNVSPKRNSWILSYTTLCLFYIGKLPAGKWIHTYERRVYL